MERKSYWNKLSEERFGNGGTDGGDLNRLLYNYRTCTLLYAVHVVTDVCTTYMHIYIHTQDRVMQAT